MTGDHTNEPQDWYAFTACRITARAYGVAESELRGDSRERQQVAFARQVAMYLAHCCYRLTYGEVAEAFERDRTTVAHACAVVEDARDEGSALDKLLSTLEQRLGDLAELTTGYRTSRCAAEEPRLPLAP